MTSRRALALAGTAVLVVAALAASAAGSSMKGTTTNSATAGITLTTWDAETGKGGALDQLNALFQKKYGVKVDRVKYSFNDLQAKLRLGLSGPNPPDVVQLAGIGGNGASVIKANLLTNLDGYAAKYGWRKRFSPTYLAYGMYTKDGKIGSGNLYAVGQKAEFVGMYYSKSRLKKLGFAVPKTLAQFETILAAAKAKGIAPILFADSDGWPGAHYLQGLTNVLAGTSKVNVVKFAYGQPGPSVQGTITKAATKLQAWSTAGYFTASPASRSYNDAVSDLAKGDSLFFLTGTWLGPSLAEAMHSDVGIFLLPPVKAGGGLVATGSESTPWGIPSKSKNQDIAAKYLDFITNSQAATLMMKNGDLPGAATSYQPPKNSIQRQFLLLFRQLAKQNGLIPYMDNAAPTLPSVLYPGIQELIAGKTTPVALATKVQKIHDTFVRTGK